MTRFQVSGALVAVVASVGVVLLMIFVSPRVPFIFDSGGVAWIAPPEVPRPRTIFADGTTSIPATFSHHFSLAEAPPEAVLQVKALGAVALQINDRPVPLPSTQLACFKTTCRAPVARLLRRGRNQVSARVENPIGPPLLWLRIEGDGLAVATSPGWRVETPGQNATAAVRADDTRPYQSTIHTVSPAQALVRWATLLLFSFGTSAGLFLWGRHRMRDPLLRHLPEVTLCLVTLFWVYLFLAKFSQIPLYSGYDGKQHVEYVRFLLEHRSLPLATDGFEMYHPPAFYAVAAGLTAVFAPLVGEDWGLKLAPFLCGLGVVWVTYALARRIFGNDHGVVAFAVVVAGVVPLNVYASAYVWNEPLHAFLAGLALYAAVRLFLSREASLLELAGLSAILGLLLLTKFTALAVVVLVPLSVAFKLFFVDGARLGRVVGIPGALLLGALLLGGWFYLRNWLVLGDPFVSNLDLPRGLLQNWFQIDGDLLVATGDRLSTYWQPPGFHTAGYFLGFGESLRQPFFSVFHSYWDGLYSTVWGEGLPPLGETPYYHYRWNLDLMPAAYPLALPATAIGMLGFALALGRALGDPDSGRRCAFTLLTVVVYATVFVWVTLVLRYPYWSGPRATYLLCLVVPAAICSSLGLSAVDRWLARPGWTLQRAAFYGWLGTLVTVLVLSFAA